MNKYDVVIIGAGVAGLFTAMRLVGSHKKILMIDIGQPLTQRLLQLGEEIATNQSPERYYGFGGLGLSEGKYNYTNDFGGDLAIKIGAEQSMLYQQYVDQLLCQFGANQRKLYNTYDAQLAQRANQHGFKILTTKTRHLGTVLSVNILKAFAQALTDKIEFRFQTIVDRILPHSHHLQLKLSNQESVLAVKVIIAVGHKGLAWFESIQQQLNLTYGQTRLDLGFRIEMHQQQLQSLLQKTIETKLLYQTDHYRAFSYCMNPCGRVIAKYQDGLVMPDGQNCAEVGPSGNLNFTLFIPKWFAQRQAAEQFLKQTISKINRGHDTIMMQRLSDIDSRFAHKFHSIVPTLKTGVFADLVSNTPTDYLAYTCDFLYALQRLLEQPIDGNTLLYAMDSKSYAPQVKTNRYFASDIKGLYVIGDCSGVTSSLSQAAASGLYVADHINCD